MDRLTRCVPAFLFLTAALVMAPEIIADTPASVPAGQSQCVQCHTRVKGLIRLSWEVEKLHMPPVRSAETSGEG
jgi:hypothetical protein